MADWNVCAGCGEEIPDLLWSEGKWWCTMPCLPDGETRPEPVVADQLEEPDKWHYNKVREMAIKCGVEDVAICIGTHYELHVEHTIAPGEREEAAKMFWASAPKSPNHEGPVSE